MMGEIMKNDWFSHGAGSSRRRGVEYFASMKRKFGITGMNPDSIRLRFASCADAPNGKPDWFRYSIFARRRQRDSVLSLLM